MNDLIKYNPYYADYNKETSENDSKNVAWYWINQLQ